MMQFLACQHSCYAPYDEHTHPTHYSSATLTVADHVACAFTNASTGQLSR